MITYSWDSDWAGGITITKSNEINDLADCYLQPGDDANQFDELIDSIESEEIQQYTMSQYDDVMRDLGT